MSTLTIRERIIALVKTTLEAIVPSAYQSTVIRVFRDGEIMLNVDETPCVLKIIDRGDAMKRHIKYVYENTMTLEVMGRIVESDIATKREKLAILQGDVLKALSSNDYWSDGSVSLVARTRLVSNGITLTEPIEPDGLMLVTIQLTYRVKRNDPYTLVTL